MFAGFVLILIGFVLLLKNLGYLAYIGWGMIWPVIFIAFGLSLMTRRPYYHEKDK